MNFTLIKRSPYAKALVLVLASLCLMSCHKSKSQLSNDGAAVTRLEPGKFNANQNATEGSVAARAPEPEPEFSTSVPTPKRRRTTIRQPRRSGEERVFSEGVVAVQRVVRAKVETRRELSARSPSPGLLEAENLIKYASFYMRLGTTDVQPVTAYPTPGPTSLTASSGVHATSKVYVEAFQMAARNAEKAVVLLKEQPVPVNDPAAKDKYMTTLLEGLSVRAEALGLMAEHIDRTHTSAAEKAYREYLAAESDDAKKLSAEYKFAAMLYKVNELEKAKTIYESLLARDANDRRALAALIDIHRNIATAQKATGKTAEAEANSQLAASYSDRLSNVNAAEKPRNYSTAATENTKTRNDSPSESKDKSIEGAKVKASAPTKTVKPKL